MVCRQEREKPTVYYTVGFSCTRERLSILLRDKPIMQDFVETLQDVFAETALEVPFLVLSKTLLKVLYE